MAKKRKPSAARRRADGRLPAWLRFVYQTAAKIYGNLWQPPHLPPAARAELPPVWRALPALLALAFVLRAAVALAGDFVLHPDEIMQYLEPAHNAVFGNGVLYWEFAFGGRSWLAAGFVAAVLQLCAWLGLDSPNYYVAAVKLAFCLLSLLVPFGMYAAGRHLFGEKSARLALILGVFWYELAGFAHKPMTEFIATSLFFGLLALAARPAPVGGGRAVAGALIAVLLVAVRFHYALAAALVLLADFLRAGGRERAAMVAAGVGGTLAIGVFDLATWGGFFHSYIVNIKLNLLLNEGRAGESTPWHFLGWLFVGSGGLYAAAAAAGFADQKRRLFLLALLLLVLLPHMSQAHREYRFVFLCLPLLLMLFADFLATGLDGGKNGATPPRWLAAAGLAYAAGASVLGVFNALPYQAWTYTSYSQEKGGVHFLRGQDGAFAAYRRLAEDDSARGVFDAREPYFNTPGYYYLHRKIPLYGLAQEVNIAQLPRYASHVVTEKPMHFGIVRDGSGRAAISVDLSAGGASPVAAGAPAAAFLPAPRVLGNAKTGELTHVNAIGIAAPLTQYAAGESFGDIQLWTLASPADAASARQWKHYTIYPDSAIMRNLLVRAGVANLPPAAKNLGIEYKE